MESPKKSPKKGIGYNHLLNNIKLYFAMSVAGLLASPNDVFSQTQNNDNMGIVQYINVMTIGDYNELLQKRDHITKDVLAKFDHDYESVTDYLEQTQKQIFLNSYRNNRNLVRSNMNEIKDILIQNFKLNVGEDPIEILNMALIQISKEEEMTNLGYFTNKISTDEFDISTINAYGYVQASNKSTWKNSNGQLMPTFNITSYGSLEIIIALLKNGKYSANYDDFLHQNNVKPNGVINLDDDEEKNKPVNLDDDDEKNKPVNLDEEEKNKKEEKVKQKDEEKKNKPVNLDNEEKNEPVNLDDEEEKNKQKEDQKKKDEEEKERNKEEEKNKPVNLDDDDDEKNKPVNLDEEEKNKKEEKVKQKEDQKKKDEEEKKKQGYLDDDIDNNLIKYDFKNKLAQSLPTSEQKQNIEILINQYIIVKNFINSLEPFGIYWERGEPADINAISAVLRTIDGDFVFGYEALEIAKESNSMGNNLITSIMIQKWSNDLPKDENLDIVQNMSWNADILSKKLNKDKLNNISYQQIIDVVNGFKSDDLKKAFVYALLSDDVIAAQEIMGMELNCDSRYPNYKAGNKIGTTELNKMKKLGETRKYIDQNEVMTNKYIPQDVKNAYEKFVNGEYNNKDKPYSILSKTDFNMYLFSANHILSSRQNTLIGMDVGDQKNNPYSGSQTTPGGMYEIGNKFDKSQSGENFFQKYGTHYIVLIPLQGQYTLSNKYTMGVHGTYEKDLSRDTKIKSTDAKNRRVSNGCINIEDDSFGELFNHMQIGGILFVTSEPSPKDLQNYLINNK